MNSVREVFEKWFTENKINNGNGIESQIGFSVDNNRYFDVWDDDREPCYEYRKKQVNDLNREWATWQAATATMQEEIDRLKEEAHDLTVDYKKLDQLAWDRDETIVQLQEEVERLQGITIELSGEVGATSAQRDRFKAEVEALKGQWINPEERLPEPSERVLFVVEWVLDKERVRHVGWFDGVWKTSYTTSFIDTDIYNVIGWMPLPEPPKTQE
jgi:FtsZ-binding cell division protein ZapB